jgi:nucleoside-diphosphate-sugar epimerase
MVKAIVFGGAGFIGSHLLAKLARDGRHDELFSIDVAQPRFVVPGVSYKTHDLSTPIDPAICSSGPAEIFNLAAVHTTPGHEDWEYYWANVLGASHVCRFASQIGATDIVFTSSISVYGPSEAPKDEDSPLEPNSAYGRSKFLAESVHGVWQAEQPGRRLTVVRPAVIYGQYERGNFTRLARLLNKGRFIYPGRTDAIKSCGYVQDLVASMLFMREHNTGTVAYNFCHPERYDTEQICATFCRVKDYRRPRLVAPIWLMMFAAMGFEVLSALGYKTTVNRARVAKLFNSTNIVPKRLQASGFKYSYDLEAALRDWNRASTATDFD